MKEYLIKVKDSTGMFIAPKTLPEKENIELILAAQKDKTLLDKALYYNQKLVLLIINKHFYVSHYYDKDLVFQSGLIGLYKAIMNYDESMDFKFSSFATAVIYSQIMTGLRKSTNEKHVEKDIRHINTPLKSDNIVDGSELYDELLSTYGNPSEEYENKENYEILENRIRNFLTAREYLVYSLYYKPILTTDNPLTLEEISNLHNVSRQNIGKIKQDIDKKLSIILTGEIRERKKYAKKINKIYTKKFEQIKEG